MEDLLALHRKQQRDLQSQITQKKKAASKKTRKSVNDECDRLAQELERKQAAEVAAFDHGNSGKEQELNSLPNDGANKKTEESDDLLDSIVGSSTNGDGHNLESLHIDDVTGETGSQASSQQRKPNRQKARLARRTAEQDAARARAAEEAVNMPDFKTQERNKMLEEIKKRGLVEKEVAANGHCLYLAVADQMLQQKLSLDPFLQTANGTTAASESNVPNHKKIRAAAADYIASHPGDFQPFLEEPMADYLNKLRNTGEWGGQLELIALAKAYHININVLQGNGRIEKVESDSGATSPEAWLAYYRHGFGLGEHYNSLRTNVKNDAKE